MCPGRWGGGAVECAGLENRSTARPGSEETETCDGNSDALGVLLGVLCAESSDLALIIKSWPNLAEPVKASAGGARSGDKSSTCRAPSATRGASDR
jgi:hypothetical protein